jgi:cell division protein FtsZ
MKKKPEEKKVHELDRSQISLFGAADNSVNQQNHEIHLKMKPDQDKPILKNEEKPLRFDESDEPEAPALHPSKEETPAHDRPYMFEWNTESTSSNDEDPGEESLFGSEDEEDFKVGKSISEDQVINEEGLMEIRRTKERLEEQARKRREKLKATKKQEMTKEEFNEKWTLPAYLRRGVKMDNVPHSSEPFISRYNLNDDNNLLGNNKFLHDNVD